MIADSKTPFYITTPIYYVNDAPHIGHAYTTIACDVMARFMQLNGHEIFFLTGTDEHGQKVAKSAEKAGVTPQEICDKNSQYFRNLVATGDNLLNASNNDFVRTTEARHKQTAQELWKRIEANGYIYKDNYGGWYAVRDEAYYAEAELITKDGKKVAPTGAEVEWVEEESYFFKLSAFEGKLLELYGEGSFVSPDSRLNEVKSFVKGGLRDLSISRTSFDWGVPVPDDENHVMYVWIDALTNYLTALGWPDSDNYQKFWAENPPVHVVGKDILRFHAVYWPAFLMAAELPVPKQVLAHGWWTIEGEKMSKSIGNVLSPAEMIEKAGGVDQLRYFMLKAMPFGNDGDFSQERMIEVINADLANNIGNLAQRSLSMIQKNCDAKVPTYVGKQEELMGKLYSKNREDYLQAMQEFRYNDALLALSDSAHVMNHYFADNAPWVLRKTDPEKMAEVLHYTVEGIRCVAILLQPFCPEASAKILDQLAVPEDERGFEHLSDQFALKVGTDLPKPEGVFPRLQVAEKVA
ncbi:MAG: methionine--tRNA ligase [Rickettsiales bacterium]|nr:methionine--tRNA ligase [Rickettsiales bacterium]